MKKLLDSHIRFSPVSWFLENLNIHDVVLSLGELLCLENVLPVLPNRNAAVFIADFDLNCLFFRLPFEDN